MAAEKHNAEAQFMLGTLYLEEDSNSEEAIKYLDAFVVSSRFTIAEGLYSFGVSGNENRSLETTYKIAKTYMERLDYDKVNNKLF